MNLKYSRKVDIKMMNLNFGESNRELSDSKIIENALLNKFFTDNNVYYQYKDIMKFCKENYSKYYSENKVIGILNRLVNKSILSRTGRGVYKLTSDDDLNTKIINLLNKTIDEITENLSNLLNSNSIELNDNIDFMKTLKLLDSLKVIRNDFINESSNIE